MRKPKPLSIEPYPEFEFDRDYAVRVMAVRIRQRALTLRVTLKHLERDQEGREEAIDLSLPIRPAGPAAEFICACGIEITPSTTIDPRQLVGCEVRLRRTTIAGDRQVLQFRAR